MEALANPVAATATHNLTLRDPTNPKTRTAAGMHATTRTPVPWLATRDSEVETQT